MCMVELVGTLTIEMEKQFFSKYSRLTLPLTTYPHMNTLCQRQPLFINDIHITQHRMSNSQHVYSQRLISFLFSFIFFRYFHLCFYSHRAHLICILSRLLLFLFFHFLSYHVMIISKTNRTFSRWKAVENVHRCHQPFYSFIYDSSSTVLLIIILICISANITFKLTQHNVAVL